MAEGDDPVRGEDENEEGGLDGEKSDGEEDEESSESESDDDEEADDDSSSGEESDDDDDDDDDNGPNDGLSHYERLRLERIARNNARLAQLGFSEEAPARRAKRVKKTPGPRRRSQEGPRRHNPGRAKRATFDGSAAKRGKRSAGEKNPDACWECQKAGGELRSCDYCRRLYHPRCHVPEILADDEEFKCALCETSGRTRRVACGKCDGCLRETDCMTCVACVSKYRGAGSQSKCIFRKCQSLGRAKSARANDDDISEEGEEDRHDEECYVCKNGGDLICCDGCTKVYHSYCHKPKIHDLPEGEWYCMHCVQSRKAAQVKENKTKENKLTKEKKPKYTGPLVANLGHCKVMCTVGFPKIECVVCEEVEVTGASRPSDWVSCRVCDDSYHLKCADPPLEKQPNKWRCPHCKANKRKVKKKKVKKEKVEKQKEPKPLFEGEHDDVCFMCFMGGDLLCCDYCEKAYHLECHLPPLAEIPSGNWKCQECSALEYTRKMKCGVCEACMRPECGKCVHCLDKPKFGGPNKLKQACLKKKCPYLRFAPPAKLTPQSTQKKTKKEIKLQFAENASSTTKRKRNSVGDGGQEYAPKKKRGRQSKRQKVVESPNASEKSPDEAGKLLSTKKHKDLSDAANQSELFKADPISNKVMLIIAKALNHPDKPEIQGKACKMLCFMAAYADHASKIILLGGLKFVSKVMKDYPQMAFVQAQASALLAALMWVNRSCIAAIKEEGFMQFVLNSMECHGSQVNVQQMGCGFFRSMSYDFASHPSINAIDGVGSIINVMKRNVMQYGVLKEGCYFLQNILCNPDIETATISLLISKGTAPLLVDAIMRGSSEDIEYFEAACCVLANLALKKSAREHIGDCSSTLPALLTLLGPGISADACKSSLNVLKLLAAENDGHKSKMGHLGGITTLVNFLTPSRHAALANTGLSLLAVLIKGNTTNAQQLIDAGGFEFVASEMGKHPNLPFIQASCCGVLRNLPGSDADQAIGAANLILSAMKNHQDDQKVQFEGCHALLNFCTKFPFVVESMQSKITFPITPGTQSSKRHNFHTSSCQVTQGIEFLSRSVSAHVPNDNPIRSINSSHIDRIIMSKPVTGDPVGNKIRTIIIKASKRSDNSETQGKACEILRCMATSSENVSKIIVQGGLKMILMAMIKHPQKPILQAEASALLAELAWVNQACIAAIIKEGCPQLVLRSMQCHTSHAKVQQMGCSFFRALSYDLANHQSIDAVNGARAVIEAMMENMTKYEVLKEGCHFLQNMLCNPGIAPETIQLLMSKNLIFILIGSIHGMPDDADYLGAACGVLANLALDKNARGHIGSCDSSVPTFLNVIGSGVDMDACKCSLNALKLLATGSNNIKAEIARLGGITTVMSFLTPPNELTLVDSGLGFLAEFMNGNKENCQLLLDASGFEFVKTEMTNYANSSHLQTRACGVLRDLPIGAADVHTAVGLVLAAMKTHKEDSMVQYEGCHTLLQYCVSFPITAELLRSEEASTIILQSQFS